MHIVFVGGTGPVGATAAEARQLAALAERASVGQLVVTSSIDVCRHAALSSVDGFEPAELPPGTLPLTEGHPRRPPDDRDDDNVSMEDALAGAPRITILRPGAIYGPHDHAHLVSTELGHEWELSASDWADDPDPLEATRAQLHWLREHEPHLAS